MRDEEDMARKKPTDKISVVDLGAIKTGATELGTKIGINFFLSYFTLFFYSY